MFLDELAVLQQKLDGRINEEHGLERYETANDKVTALLVEIGELANETRCFKFWSKKPPSEKEIILEELVDVYHFGLSLGLLAGYGLNKRYADNIDFPFTDFKFDKEVVSSQFRGLFKIASRMDEDDYQIHFMYSLLALTDMLDFKAADVVRAYKAKNKVNHERQENSY